MLLNFNLAFGSFCHLLFIYLFYDFEPFHSSLIFAQTVFSICSYFTPHWDHLKGKSFSFFILGFHYFSSLSLYLKRKASLLPFLKLSMSKTELYFRIYVTVCFLTSSFFPQKERKKVNTCLSFSVQHSCHCCYWLFPCPSLYQSLLGTFKSFLFSSFFLSASYIKTG